MFVPYQSYNIIPEKYPSRKEPKPGEAPSNNEDAEDDITEGVQLGVVEQLGQLKENVREVMNNKNQSSTSATFLFDRQAGAELCQTQGLVWVW